MGGQLDGLLKGDTSSLGNIADDIKDSLGGIW